MGQTLANASRRILARPTGILAIALCVSGRHEGQVAQEGPAGPTPAELQGHQKMVQLLAELRSREALEDEFIGQGPLRELKEKLAAVQDREAAPKLVAVLQYGIGTEELRLGHGEEALSCLLDCQRILAGLPRDERPSIGKRLALDIGIAHMRIAESRNCVAHHSSESCILPIQGAGVHVDPEPSRAALHSFREALAGAGEDESLRLSALWLLNVASMTLGEYPQGLSEEERIPAGVFRSRVAFPRFLDVAAHVGVAIRNLSGGAVSDDMDGDGLLDLVTSSWELGGQLRFFRNQGDGSFADVSAEAGLSGIGGGLDVDHADMDDDGDLDLLVLRGAWHTSSMGRQPKSLLRNDGGRFLDVTFLAGVAEPFFPTQAADWADFDLDGDLDFYVGAESGDKGRHPSQLFRNAGDGTFVDVAREAGVTNLRYAKGVAFGDCDEDRYPDLYVSNAGTRNRLYHNRGDGTFVDVAADVGVGRPIKSFPVWFWDFDNDGHLDLYVSSYSWPDSQETPRLAAVVASYLGMSVEPFGAELGCLYKGDGRGGFANVAGEMGLTLLGLAMGANSGDLDNDGFLDFYLGTGYPTYDGLIPNVMYWNRAGRSFEDVTFAGGFGHLQKGHGIVFADFDGDGDQDVFEEMGGGYAGDGFMNVLFENPGFGNHWLQVRLVGTESNRFGVGSRLRAEILDGSARRSVYGWVDSGGSFGSNSYIQHLGLGQATKVETLEVTWPRTGATQVFRDVPVDGRIEITEGSPELRVVPVRSFRFKSAG